MTNESQKKVKTTRAPRKQAQRSAKAPAASKAKIMWRLILGWAATPAATAWVLFGGLALATVCYVAYDHRGDRIAELELDLIQCKGTAKQTKAIQELSKEIQKQAQEQADDDIEKLNAIPNDECFHLDDPSPLDRVRGPRNEGKDS